MTDRFARIPSRVAGIRDLGARDLRILIAIAAHADVKGRAFPSLARIAALTGLGLDRSKVPPCIRKLVAAGLLRTSHRRDEFGDAASTVYEILFDDAGVLPLVGTSAAAGGNTVLPLVGTRGVAVAGTLTDHSFNRPPNRHSATLAAACCRRGVRQMVCGVLALISFPALSRKSREACAREIRGGAETRHRSRGNYPWCP